MFVLTCPSCNHASRVKFARFNALATCPGCNARFRVDARTASIDRHGEVGGVVHDLDQVVPTPSELEVKGGPDPSAFATRRGEEEVPAEEIWDEVFGSAPAARRPVVHELPLDWKPRRRGLYLPDQVPLAVVGVLLLVSILATGLVVGIWRSGSAERAVVYVPVDESSQETETEGDAETQVAGTGSAGEGDQTQPAQNGETDDVASEQVASATPDEIEDASSTDAAAGDWSGWSGVDDGGAGTSQGGGREAGLPEMQLQRSIAYESRWQILNEPRRAMYPSPQSDVLLWLPRLQRDEEAGRTMFTAMFLAETDRVYQSGFLHVQLLNDEGEAFAELKQVVPAVNARQGLQVRLMVPPELEERSTTVVAQFTPVDPLPRAAPIEAVPSRTRVNSSSDGPVLELTVMNPNSEPVTDPEVVVELLTRDGWPVSMYRGTVKGTIEPGATMAFVLRPSEADAASEPGRVEIRGYAYRQ